MIGNLPAVVVALFLQSDRGRLIVFALHQNAQGFAGTATTFSFSMLGFLAAAMGLLSLLGQTGVFAAYRRRGYLSVLLCATAATMVELTLSFVAALRLFFTPVTDAKLACALVALAAAIGMVLLAVAPIIGMQIRAANHHAVAP